MTDPVVLDPSSEAQTPSLPEETEERYCFGSSQTSNLVITVGQMNFHVHWEVMASASLFFEKMRSSGMTESRNGQVKLASDCPKAWRALVSRL